MFTDLEFKTLGKRLLGDDFSFGAAPRGVVEKEIPQGVQTDLFGNIVETGTLKPEPIENGEEREGMVADKNINNTKHDYKAVEEVAFYFYSIPFQDQQIIFNILANPIFLFIRK